jgi:hypothetical protein
LCSAQEQRTFAEICEGLCDCVAREEAPGIAAGWLRNWVDEQIIAGAAWNDSPGLGHQL